MNEVGNCLAVCKKKKKLVPTDRFSTNPPQKNEADPLLDTRYQISRQSKPSSYDTSKPCANFGRLWGWF